MNTEQNKKKIGRTLENVITDLVQGILFDIEQLKKEEVNELNTGKMFAYFECLSRIQGEVIEAPELFGLDGDIEKKYGMYEYLTKHND